MVARLPADVKGVLANSASMAVVSIAMPARSSAFNSIDTFRLMNAEDLAGFDPTEPWSCFWKLVANSLALYFILSSRQYT